MKMPNKSISSEFSVFDSHNDPGEFLHLFAYLCEGTVYLPSILVV